MPLAFLSHQSIASSHMSPRVSNTENIGTFSTHIWINMVATEHHQPNELSSKRTSDNAGLKMARHGRLSKRRCRRACRACHFRKVRCDVDVGLRIPCNNCRLDFVEWVIPESRKLVRTRRALVMIQMSPQESSIGSPKATESMYAYRVNETYSPLDEASIGRKPPFLRHGTWKLSPGLYGIILLRPGDTRRLTFFS